MTFHYKPNFLIMKQILLPVNLLVLIRLSSCSGSDEPDYPVFMQPISITSEDRYGSIQTFEYDDYGRITSWIEQSNAPGTPVINSAYYQYPDKNTIKVFSKYNNGLSERYYHETIRLENGRAIDSEGTFENVGDGIGSYQKTYRLSFEYDPANHLVVVKQSEVTGIGDKVSDDAWNKPWTWENYLIWENGNLVEYQDYHGNSYVTYRNKFEYYPTYTDYPVINPVVTNAYHHVPLFMKGIFGENSKQLVKTKVHDDFTYGEIQDTYEYKYVMDGSKVTEYTIIKPFYTITNKVTWSPN